MTWAALWESRTLDALHSPPSLLREKTQVLLFALNMPSCASYCKPSPFFFFLCFQQPQSSKLCQFYQHSQWNKRETSSLGGPIKSCNIGHILFSWGRRPEPGVCSKHWAVPAWNEADAVKWNCTDGFQCSSPWLWLAWGIDLVTEFWISYKDILVHVSC